MQIRDVSKNEFCVMRPFCQWNAAWGTQVMQVYSYCANNAAPTAEVIWAFTQQTSLNIILLEK
jgi:hypothetical protein